MKYNDYAMATFEQFAIIAKEYQHAGRVKINALSLDSKAQFDEILAIASSLFESVKQLNDKINYNSNVRELYEALKRANSMLKEYYKGEFGQVLAQDFRPIGFSINDHLEKIKLTLVQLIKKLLRLDAPASKKEILHNIVDMYIEMFNLL